MSLYVDTSAWYAAADRGDSSHRRITKALAGAEPLVTSDHVLIETWLLLRHRLGRKPAERFWEGLRSGAAEIEPVTAADLEVAWAVGEDFPDQDFSIVDRTSFAVMLRLGLRRVASLDEDFAVFRFGPSRRQAFDVVR
jgi:predicted nucleic acid-binding protein